MAALNLYALEKAKLDRTLLAMMPAPVRALVLMLALVATPLALAAERPSTIPERFRGLLMAEARYCSASATDESRLVIGADQISFYESTGPVLAIVTRGPDQLALISELSGEGSTWLDLRHYSLSPDHRQLTEQAPGLVQPFQLVRCA